MQKPIEEETKTVKTDFIGNLLIDLCFHDDFGWKIYEN